MKKFTNEMGKTQYHCDYVIILSIFIQEMKHFISITIQKFQQYEKFY